MPPNAQSAAVPAQLSLLAIYNPALGTTDETLHEQIVFYHSNSASTRSPRRTEPGIAVDARSEQESSQEQLRQIGLAQGMVSFAKNFSNGEPVNDVQTEKSRIILHELETNWWILAKVDLTRLPPSIPPSSTASHANSTTPSRAEYSSREIAPPYLIRQQLVKAHSLFLLHHAPSFGDLYDKLSSTTFRSIIDRFWSRFVWNWDILLNGNPMVDILNGIKLAGAGELGIGVGEEEWGSGEREVLEEFVSKTEGLADVIVSRFGDAPPSRRENEGIESSGETSSDKYSWVGCDTCPGPHDGVIFSGVGALSRFSLTQVSQWMEWIYRYGRDAYGVGEDPMSPRRRRRKKAHSSNKRPRGRTEPKVTGPSRGTSTSRAARRSQSPGIPPPLVVGSNPQPSSPAKPTTEDDNGSGHVNELQSNSVQDSESSVGTDTFMKILTLGYGSTWGNTSKDPPPHPRVDMLRGDNALQDSGNDIQQRPGSPSRPSSAENAGIVPLDESPGHFILGLRDDLENEYSDDEDDPNEDMQEDETKRKDKSKIILRTLHIKAPYDGHTKDKDTVRSERSKELRVVVYLYQPFMYTFLFEPETASLSSASFYRSIHHRLGPLQKPLLSSTSPDRIPERLAHNETYQGPAAQNLSQQQLVYDVIFDPSSRVLHTSLPNIPEPASATQRGQSTQRHAQQQPPWSRLEALNIYAQLVNTYIETRSSPSDMERTCKTNRGWWVLWMRLQDRITCGRETAVTSEQGSSSSSSSHDAPPRVKEAFLVRKAGDHSTVGQNPRTSSGSGFLRNLSGLAAAAGGGGRTSSRGGDAGASGKIGEGVGLDARRYIESLLSLSR